MANGTYYTPKEIVKIADPSSGTGAFLKNAADSVIGNPPYAFQHSVQRMGLWARLKKWFGAIAHR